MPKLETFAWMAAAAALGTIVAAIIVNWGRENDIPLLTQAHEGFDG